MDVDIGARFHASEAASLDRLAIYLADRDRDEEEVDLRPWVERVVRLLTDINDGCTQLPIARGTWREDSVTTYDRTIVIYTFIRDSRLFLQRLDEIVALLHRYGVEARQKSVMFEFSGGGAGSYTHRAYWIAAHDYINFAEG